MVFARQILSTGRVMLTLSTPAPEDYYQNNCLNLFGYVLERYRDLLVPNEANLLQQYLDASDNAQRLLARLLTRRGPLFRLEKLAYREIDSIDDAVTELSSRGMLNVNPEAPSDQWLALLKKDELLDFLVRLSPSRKGTKQVMTLRKAELVSCVLDGIPDRRIRQEYVRESTVIAICAPQTWDLARLLFFGETHQDWTTFVLKDLGMVRYETVHLSKRQFDNREHLEAYLGLLRLDRLSQMLSVYPQICQPLAEQLVAMSGDRFFARRRDRALLRIAGHLEKLEMFDEAVMTYKAVSRHPARERMIRINAKKGQLDTVNHLLEMARSAPYSEEERQFTDRFGRRGGGFQPEVFTVEVPRLDSARTIEEQALEYLQTNMDAAFGIHTENSFIKSLTGLVYWPVIFADVPGAFTNPFQAAPNDLYLEDFISVRSEIVTLLESTLADDSSFRMHLQETVRSKSQLANGLVDWSMFGQVSIEQVLKFIPVDHIRKLSAFQIRHLAQFRTGMPDLFVVHATGSYEFVEVKGPGDQLQPVQRLWFKRFAELSIPARVMKIKVARH